MSFNVSIGFQNIPLEGESGKVYAVFLADTVILGENGNLEILTEKASKQFNDISYFLKGEDEEKGTTPKPKTSAPLVNTSNIVEKKFRQSTEQRVEDKNSTFFCNVFF